MGVRRLLLRAVLPIRAAIRVSVLAAVLAALYPLPAAAIAARNVQAIPAVAYAQMTEADIQQMREKSSADARDKAIADAKLEVIAAGNSRLENWIAIYGILIAVLLAGFGFITFRHSIKAAELAKEQVGGIKDEMISMRDTSKRTAGQIVEEHAKAVRLTNATQAVIDRPTDTTPSETPVPLQQQQELQNAAHVAADTPRKERTAQDFRVLMYQAQQDQQWQTYADLAEGMAYLCGDNPDDLASALFGKAIGQQSLGNHELAVSLWADYVRRCPNDDDTSRSMALNNWGSALAKQAGTKQSDAADVLFAEAYAKYAAALDINSGYLKALCNWGTALSKQARTKQGDTADALFAQAGKKFDAALTIKPEYIDALKNWGNALLKQAQIKQGEERIALLDQAEKKLFDVEGMKLGFGAYNIACLFGLRGDAEATAGWLRKAKDANLNCPDCAEIGAESNFDAVRGAPEFVQALADIGC